MFDIKISYRISDIDEMVWNSIGEDYPFSSYEWYGFGEAVLNYDSPIYILLFMNGVLVAKSTFWVRRNESLPISSRILRDLVKKVIAHRPLIPCQIPLGNDSGLIIPDQNIFSDALKLIVETAEQIADKNRASFIYFPYLEPWEARDTGWPRHFGTVNLEPGSYLAIQWETFDQFLGQLGKSVRKDYRRHRNRANDAGIQVSFSGKLQDSHTAYKLIDNVNKKHNTEQPYWVNRLVTDAEMAGGKWINAKIGNRLVGCGLILGDRKDKVLTLLGLDYSVQYIYFQLIYGAIRYSIETGTRRLYGGGGAYQLKERLGFQIVSNSNVVFSARNPVFRRIGKLLASKEAKEDR